MQRPINIPAATVTAALTLAIFLPGCSKNIEDTPAYQAACHGSPLRSIEQREKAKEDGYEFNHQFDCIDKASFAHVEQQRAQWRAENTPEAIAERKAKFAAQHELDLAEGARQAAAIKNQTEEALPPIVLRNVDVNTASEDEIANVITVSEELAAQIVEERKKGRFSDWADLINRVVGLSAAQPAAFASICGLTVNGRSLDGAPQNLTMAAALQRKYSPARPG